MSASRETIGKQPVLSDGTKVPISPAIREGNLIFLSGQLGMDDEGKVVSDCPEEQTEACIRRLQRILEGAGSSLSDISKANIWITEKQVFPAVNKVWAQFFGDSPPARSTVVSDLLIPGALVEIDAIAVVDAK